MVVVTPTRLRRSVAILLVLVLTLSAVPAVAVDDFVDPRFETYVPDPTLDPGAEQTVTIRLVNDATAVEDRARKARNVRVEARSGDMPLDVLSGPQLVGTVADGDVATVEVRVAVPADIDAGRYRLPLRVTYEFREDRRRTDTVRATVRVEDRARIRVTNATSDVVVGETGVLTVTVANVGSAVARETRLTLAAGDADVRLGGGAEASRFAGTLEPGDRRRLSFVVSAAATAEPQRYALAATATYETRRGTVATSVPTSVGVTPSTALDFAARDVRSDLRVGEEGTLRTRVVNTGDRPARRVVVTADSPSPVLRFTDPAYPVGTLAPGENATVEFPVAVADRAERGPRPVTLSVEYQTDDGTVRTADPIRRRQPVAPERDRFELTPINATFVVDTDDRFTVRITNVGEEPLRDVDARLRQRPPFTSEAPGSFVPVLRPGESARLAFAVTVAEDAVANTHAIPINVTAETPDDETVVTGPHLVRVSVVEESGTGGDVAVLAAGAVVALLVLGAGWLWLRR